MTEHYKVLLVEDDQVDRMAFERFVRTENLPYDYTVASSLAEARQSLGSAQFDVALMDFMLGDGTSLELFNLMSNLPIIMITGSGDLELAVKVMKAGAYDYLPKDPQGNYLTALHFTVRSALERWQIQRDAILYRNHLEKVAEEKTVAWLEGELRLRTIVEAAPIIVFSLDSTGRITFMSGHTDEILGFQTRDMQGQNVFTLFPGLPEAEHGFQRIMSGESVANDVQINGRWLAVSASPKWEHEAVTGVIGVVQDITERKRAELAVAEERNLLRTLIDNIPDYIFIKDREGRFVETNQAHALAAKLTRDEIINHTAQEVFDPELAEQFHKDDSYVLSSGQSILNEERISTDAIGNERWMLTTKVPLRDRSTDQIVGLVGISRDITDRRQAEKERLAAERMRIEVEAERELVELKQRFIATASHDFRSPLTIIKMAASTLEGYWDRMPSEKRATKLDQIISNTDRMVNLLDDVLTLSKSYAGKTAVSPSTFDLHTFCDRVWNDMVEMDEQKHPATIDDQTTIGCIVADEHLLHHAFVNLLSNAFKYTPAGGQVHFHISSDDEFIYFRISDTGSGIPAADLKHLFEPFYRASNTKKSSGTGLGLSIVKTNIDAHGGTVEVQSEEGVGTTFTVKLPVTTAVAPAASAD